MADSCEHTSVFPNLHWLYQSLRSSHILGSTIVAQDLLSDPALLAHRSSSQTSPNTSSSSAITPKKQVHPRDPRSYVILQVMPNIISASAVAPFERVYSLMQCQNEMLKYGYLSTPYKGMMDCLRRTIKNEGVLSLWRGNSMNVIRPLTIEAFYFAYVHLRHNSTIFKDKEVHKPPLWFLYLGGMLGLLLQYPLDYTRIRLATDVKAAQVHFSLDSSGKNISNAFGNRKFNGVYDVFKKTMQLEGIAGFYRGCTATCVGGFFAYQASTVVYSRYTEKLTKEKHPYSARIAPIIFIYLPVVFYPFLTVSHRMMMTSGEVTKYKGAVDAVRQIVKHEGASSLYKGLGAYVVHCFAKDAIVVAFLLLGVLKY